MSKNYLNATKYFPIPQQEITIIICQGLWSQDSSQVKNEARKQGLNLGPKCELNTIMNIRTSTADKGVGVDVTLPQPNNINQMKIQVVHFTKHQNSM